MIRSHFPRRSLSRQSPIPRGQSLPSHYSTPLVRSAIAIAAFAILAVSARAQVITIDTSGKNAATSDGAVDLRYRQIQPTHVQLSKTEINPKTRIEILRTMQAEQGFAMRPLPRGRKGLTLVANGKLQPAGEAYLNMVVEQGLSVKPGDSVLISDVKFDHNKMIFEFNGGPDLKHRILRHIEIGGGMGTSPVVQDDGTPATGSRLTLEFKDHVPEMTGADVKALLAPLISFDVKTPIQAFTDTLPPQLKNAILTHQVLVGMSTDMVLFAMGHPLTKSREMEGQEPFEEWIYGRPPDPVYFVRINGNRVIRLEVAKVGEPIQVFSTDVVSGMMRTDGKPVLAQNTDVHVIKEGDAEIDPNKEAAPAPPSLTNPGETVGVNGDQKATGTMRPVQPPKPNPEYEPDVNPDQQPATPTPAQPATTQPASTQPAAAPAQAPSTPQPSPTPSSTTPSSN
ncbi:MAG: hypothetical protein WBE74_24330 [Terracidiphilus sp.]